jgi:putative FmdB family regulatory protein
MPIYEYKCPNGHLLEVFHGMTEPGPDRCEVCGASPLVRVLHPVAVHYKGSGFYSTDYGRGSRKSGKDGGAAESSSTSSDSGSSSSDAGSSGSGTGSKGSDSASSGSSAGDS